MTTTEPSRYLRRDELCRYMDCGPSFIHKLVHQGKLTPRRVSPRCTLYSLDEVHKWIESTAKDCAPTDEAA